LNEYPAKVDVQIRVTEGAKQHIFSGIGSCQRDDDDPRDFGGIVFIYNDQEVQLYTPILSDSPSQNSRGVFAYTGELLYFLYMWLCGTRFTLLKTFSVVNTIYYELFQLHFVSFSRLEMKIYQTIYRLYNTCSDLQIYKFYKTFKQNFKSYGHN
jgi:hypothetical protein